MESVWHVFACDPDTNGALIIIRDSRVGVIDSVEIIDCPVTKVRGSNRVCPARLAQLLGSYTFPPGTSVYLEEATTESRFSAHYTLVQGTSYGTWLSALTNVGLTVHTVTGRAWKAAMGLTGQTKDASRGLPKIIYPEVAKSLDRKRDHGRAEALLIAAHGHLHGSAFDDEFKVRVRKALGSGE